jgi:hypothetical protein
MRKPTIYVNALLLVCLLLGVVYLARTLFHAGDSGKPAPVHQYPAPSLASENPTKAQARELARRDDEAELESAIQSRRIIVARCVTANLDIASFTTLEIVKGDKSESGVVWIRYDKFSPGDEAVLFLPEDKPADNRVINPLNVARIYSDAGGRKFVNPKLPNLRLFHAKDDSPYSNDPQSCPLEDFLFSVKKVISPG